MVFYELNDLITNLVIFNLEIFPVETLRERQRFLWHISGLNLLDHAFGFQLVPDKHYWFLFPKLMDIKQLLHILQPNLFPIVF